MSTRQSLLQPKSSKSKTKSLGYEERDLSHRERKMTSGFSKAISRFDRRGLSNFSKLNSGVASTVLAAYLGFRDPRKRRREYLIPKDKAAWLEWLVYVAKKRINVEYLTDKELRKVIIRARPNLGPKKGQGQVEDPALPPCITWNEKEVGDWISSMGWPELRETFVKNVITGRRLALIDCTALNKMGMTDLVAMRAVTGEIRKLLGTPPPNGLRPLMRIPPYERFLRRKVYNGRNYDELTFEKFCSMEGFNYDMVEENKNAQIPCTCEVIITTKEQAEEGSSDEEEDEDHSLKNAPTVEYLVRNALVRNKIVDQIMTDILENVFLPPRERKYGKEVWGSLKRGVGEGYDDLHLYYSRDKLEFASGVAHNLIDELYRTVAILNDISLLEKHVKEEVTEEDKKMCQQGAAILMEEAAPIAALMALGELDLESIFQQEPTFKRFVNEVIVEAEKRTNALVPDAAAFVDDVINEAWKTIPDTNLTGLDPELKRSILKMANEVLYGISEERDAIVESVLNSSNAAGLGKGGKTGSTTSRKEGGNGSATINSSAGAKGKGHPVKQPQGKHRTSQQVGSGDKSHTRHSHTTQEGDEYAAEETNNEATENSSTEKQNSEQRTSQPEAESQRTIGGDNPPETRESGSNSENKPPETAGNTGAKGKGKGKKHKKADTPTTTPSAGPPGGGEGEGTASLAEPDGAENEQNYTVQSVEVSQQSARMAEITTKDHQYLSQKAQPKPVALTLEVVGTGERRGSPLPRSPMTVTTPTSAEHGRESPIPRSPMTVGTAGRLLTGEINKIRTSFASSEGNDRQIATATMEKSTPIGIIHPLEESDNTAAHGMRPPTPGKLIKPKIRRMSTEQDRKLQPPLPIPMTQLKELPSANLSIQIHGEGQAPPEGVNPRQGKALPPSQQEYNQQKHMVEQEKQRQQETKPGEKPKPAIYHQRRGVIVKGEKDTTPKFGAVFEPEEVPPLQRRGVDNSHETLTTTTTGAQKPEKKTNFVLIPKTIKPVQVLAPPPTTAVTAPATPQQQEQSPPTQPVPVSVPHPKRQIHAATTEMPPSIINLENQGDKSSVKSDKTKQSKKLSTISVSAQEIWDQMKEQYEKGKSPAENKQPQSAPTATPGDMPPSKEETTEEQTMMGDTATFPPFEEKRGKKRTLMSHTEFVVDQQHVQEMREHRQTVVEDWARRHSQMDAAADKDERARLVRMTADKVINEICTMALTHLLQEAEAGKNTQKIMDTLRKLKTDPKQEKTPYDITLWESELDDSGHKKKHPYSSRPNAPPVSDAAPAHAGLYQKGRLSNQSDKGGVRKSDGQQQKVLGTLETAGKLPLRSILHRTGDSSAPAAATDGLKAQAKNVMVNAVKDAYDNTGKTKPQPGTSKTVEHNGQYITRL